MFLACVMTWLTILPYLLSVWTLCAMWLAGSNPRHGWYMALAGQVLWFAYTWAADAWGFLPLNIGLTFVYLRNFAKAAKRPDTTWELQQALHTMIFYAAKGHPQGNRTPSAQESINDARALLGRTGYYGDAP